MAFSYISNLIDNEDPIIIMPYGGYGNGKTIHGQARVLEDEGITEHSNETILGNLVRSFKRFETDEIRGANVEATWEGGKTTLTSDSEGYIYLNIDHQLKLEQNGTFWMPLEYTLKEGGGKAFSVKSSIMVPSKAANFGIISDMDETVLQTGLDSFLRWKVILNTFTAGSKKRIPLAGAQEFYSMLVGGRSGDAENPIFYLSNSPWNLYDYLTSFLEYHKFPKGPLLLRDIGLENKKKTSFLEGNKFVKISHILKTYPELPFVLIGDGEDLDPEIYLEIAKQFPEQIMAIYIRSVTDEKKTLRIARLIERTKNVEVKLISHTNEAIAHARTEGLIG